ncbi:phosphatase PAP2 family protein [Mumia sp. DW29H23]|uniref:phosphatase PAP2 family protein n=1 Tax=Mumia sp. DW29H23 TaxID=3421241 RepID=UPI003D691C50
MAPDTRNRHGWYWRTWLVVAGFAVVTLIGSRVAGIPVRDPGNAFFLSRLAIALPGLAVLALADAAWRTRPWSVRATLATLRARWTPRRIALAVSALVAYYLVYLCYHNLKSWDVLLDPRDDLLLRWDRWLFLGSTPGAVLHDLLGEHTAMYVVSAVYMAFTPVVTTMLVGSLVFTERVRHGFVMVVGGMWAWILGVGSYYLIPSLGPFWRLPEEYAGLPRTAIQDMWEKDVVGREHLLAHPEAPDALAQISAFASLHVAFTTLVFLMARYYGLRRLSWVLGVFVLATIVATLYLGWHYVADDVAGIAIAFAAVFLGRKTIYPRRTEEPARR